MLFSLVTKKWKIKDEITLHIPNKTKFKEPKLRSLTKLSGTEDMEELEILYTAGGNANWKKMFWKTVWQ